MTYVSRGDPRFTIPNVTQTLLLQSIRARTLPCAWPQAVAISGYSSPPKKPRARGNCAALGLRRAGYRTIGEVCAAAGVPDSTLTGWEGIHIRPMDRVNGVRAIPAAQFDSYVSLCRTIRDEYVHTRRCRRRTGPVQDVCSTGSSTSPNHSEQRLPTAALAGRSEPERLELVPEQIDAVRRLGETDSSPAPRDHQVLHVGSKRTRSATIDRGKPIVRRRARTLRRTSALPLPSTKVASCQ